MKLSKISIIYMDGSSKTLSAQEIESITGAPFCRNTESVQTSLMDKAERQFKNQIGKEKESWKERKRYLNDIDEISSANLNVRSYFRTIMDSKKIWIEATENLEEFESRNYITK